MSKFVKVATVDEMRTNRPSAIEVDGEKIALFLVEGAVYASAIPARIEAALSRRARWRDPR